MCGNIYYSLGGVLDYELVCDRCGTRFDCGDDSRYSWPVLCAAAEAEGWLVGPGLDGEHVCARCASPGGSRSRHQLTAV
ncbi:MAG TPA: hypothetical protein VHG10_14320 [Glycomyces sp.]|nr:hypothetical protein [Glycomyces sp.]